MIAQIPKLQFILCLVCFSVWYVDPVTAQEGEDNGQPTVVELGNQNLLKEKGAIEKKPGRTVLEAGQQAPQMVKEHLQRFASGNCGCLPKVDINWESFEQPKYKYYSEKTLERALNAVDLLCAEDKKTICKNLRSIQIEFVESRDVVKLPRISGGNLLLETAPGYVPFPTRVEEVLREEFRLKKPKSQ